MPLAVKMLHNVLPVSQEPVSALVVKRLKTAATLDGLVDGSERRFFTVLIRDRRLNANQVADIQNWLKSPDNPEVLYVRKKDPLFDTRLQALNQHARPGDLVFWGGCDWRAALGPWRHVSLVLNDGRLLDTMAIEGASISTMEAALAKSIRRLRTTEMVVARPNAALSQAQLAGITRYAEAVEGRPYALFSRMDDPGAKLSCSRSVYEALKSTGLDIAPVSQRQMPGAVMPPDMIPQVKALGLIDAKGLFKPGPITDFGPWHPGMRDQLELKFFEILGFFSDRFPFIARLIESSQERVVTPPART
jgi:hypothetical protein